MRRAASLSGLHGSHLWGPYGFPNDAARRIATLFEKWDCLIETYLRTRRENPPRRLNLYGTFAAASFWNTRFKTYSPVS